MPALRELRQGDCKFRASLGVLASSHPKYKHHTHNNNKRKAGLGCSSDGRVLPSMHEVLGPIPSTIKLGVVEQAYNPSS